MRPHTAARASRLTGAAGAAAAGKLAAGGLAALLLSSPTPALAQGMPQLDFSTPLTTSQVVWGALIFILLYFLLSRWALPRVSEVLDQRAAAIAVDLDTARAAKTQADAAVAEMTEAVAAARAEAQGAINAAVEQAKREAAARSASLNERLEAQLASAERSIAQARQSAMAALRQVATDTAASVVGRLTGTTPEPQAVQGAVDAALAARAH